jgi:hypothetical protein
VFLASVRTIGECVEIRLAFGKSVSRLKWRMALPPRVRHPCRCQRAASNPAAPLSDLRRDYPADPPSCAIAVGSPRRAIAVATAADHYRRSGSISPETRRLNIRVPKFVGATLGECFEASMAKTDHLKQFTLVAVDRMDSVTGASEARTLSFDVRNEC